MIDLTNELNEFITVLYGKEPTMNKTWQQLYPEAFTSITKEAYRFHVSSMKASLPCDQTHFMTFITYAERLYINNAKFIHPLPPDQAMRLLQLSAQMRTKIQTEYNTRLLRKKTG